MTGSIGTDICKHTVVHFSSFTNYIAMGINAVFLKIYFELIPNKSPNVAFYNQTY